MTSECEAAPAARAPEADRLQELLRANRISAPFGLVAVSIMWAIWRTPALLVMVGLVAATIGVHWLASRQVAANEVGRAITTLSFAIWMPTLGMAVLAPDVWAIVVVLAILSVLVALPFADSRRVLGLIGGASGILLIGSYFLIRPWTFGFPPDTSPAALGSIIAYGSISPAVLCMVAAWKYHEQLVETVDQLRASERDLERKVEERTADLVASQRHLALARDQALAANQHKSAFLANMSHELRTPLNAVIGFSEMLSERVFGDLNEKQEEYVHDIHDSAKHLLSLINDILELSKIEAGKLELGLDTFPLQETIEGALTLTRERAFTRGLRQVSDIDPNLGSIEADERKVKQVLVNLLSNAVKFTDSGGVVALRARRLDDRVEIAVEDTGIGIAPEEQPFVFEEFRQVDTDQARRAEGTGLGLALVRRLVELHGGRVTLESTLGEGTCFVVTLPLRVPDDLRSEEEEECPES